MTMTTVPVGHKQQNNVNMAVAYGHLRDANIFRLLEISKKLDIDVLKSPDFCLFLKASGWCLKDF